MSDDRVFTNRATVITDSVAQNITRIEEIAYELMIKDVMTANVRVVEPAMTMAVVMELFRKHRISGVPVVDEGRLAGIISLEDLIRCLQKGDLQAPVSTYMSPKVMVLNVFDPVVKALEKFDKTRVGRLAVLDPDGKLAGIITKGDITRGLLHTLNTRFQEEEIRRYRASHLFEDIVSDRTSLILRYYTKPNDFSKGGTASSNIKRALLRMGADPQLARRCGIAIYEAEMNLIIHANDVGYIRVEIEPHQITMKVNDNGPGIADIDLALKAGYSTASEDVREMGFGAGMGLPNIKRCVDLMHIESTVGKGTHLELKIFVKKDVSDQVERRTGV
jgi:anti-sigma regulatory factor (Ser/Thr protein kinase)/CBS domain-containing protein